MKQILIISLIIFALKANSQNDTIYLKRDCLIYRGEAYNKTNTNKEKTGKWINYETQILIIPLLSECASGYDVATGMDCHWYTDGDYVYRALQQGEKEETRIIKKKTCDTINGSIYISIEADIIKSKIAPDLYYISSEGTYKNNRKHGLWKFYYESGEKRKTIYYIEDIPVESFKIYRRDGSVMLSVEKQNNSIWLVSKYSERGEKFEEKSGSIKDFELLY